MADATYALFAPGNREREIMFHLIEELRGFNPDAKGALQQVIYLDALEVSLSGERGATLVIVAGEDYRDFLLKRGFFFGADLQKLMEGTD